MLDSVKSLPASQGSQGKAARVGVQLVAWRAWVLVGMGSNPDRTREVPLSLQCYGFGPCIRPADGMAVLLLGMPVGCCAGTHTAVVLWYIAPSRALLAVGSKEDINKQT